MSQFNGKGDRVFKRSISFDIEMDVPSNELLNTEEDLHGIVDRIQEEFATALNKVWQEHLTIYILQRIGVDISKAIAAKQYISYKSEFKR